MRRVSYKLKARSSAMLEKRTIALKDWACGVLQEICWGPLMVAVFLKTKACFRVLFAILHL